MLTWQRCGRDAGEPGRRPRKRRISQFCFHEYVNRKTESTLASSGKSVASIRPARATMRDVRAIVTERGAGCDGRLLRQRGASRAGENAAAYGEVVWSWRRDPGVYPPRPCGDGNGGNKGRSPGRARSKP